MTERTRLISDLLCGLFSAILKMNTIKNNGNNFQHPRERGHSRSCSSKRDEVAVRSKQKDTVSYTMRYFGAEFAVN